MGSARVPSPSVSDARAERGAATAAEHTLAEMANRCSVDMELWDRHSNAVLALVRALRALEKAERLDAEFQEMLTQADLEGWSEATAESHLNSAWKPVAAAYELARTLRAEVLK